MLGRSSVTLLSCNTLSKYSVDLPREIRNYFGEQVLTVQVSTGCPKKMVIWKGFEFLTLGGVFLGVKIILRTLGTKKKYKVV